MRKLQCLPFVFEVFEAIIHLLLYSFHYAAFKWMHLVSKRVLHVFMFTCSFSIEKETF